MAEKRVYGIFCGWLLVLCLLPGLIQAAELTREHILAMHNGGIRMALGKADGTSEKPYVIPVDIDPAKLLGTELLDFSGRPLVELPPWLGRFNKLRKLDLSKTGIKADDALLAALGNMPELDVLKLSDNPLFPEKSCWMFCDPEVSLAAVWSKLTGLTEINLTNTGGTAANLGSFAALENLTHLYLGGNRIGDEVNKLGLGNPSNVRYLNLANNGIHDSPLPCLPTQTLVELDLSGNALSEVPFIDMPNLVAWDVSGNPKLKLAEKFGSMFALQRLQILLPVNTPSQISLSLEANTLPFSLPQIPLPLVQRMQRLETDRQAVITKAAEEQRLAEEKAAEKKRLAEEKAAEEKRRIKRLKPFRINNDGTVTDTKTGLMWKRCSEGQRGADCSIGTAKKYQSGITAISKLGSKVNFASYSDWRMPNNDELKSLVHCSTPSDLNYISCGGFLGLSSYDRPTINQLAFPNTPVSEFCSSTLQKSFLLGNFIQVVGFDNGSEYQVPDDSVNCNIRLVRGGQ